MVDLQNILDQSCEQHSIPGAVALVGNGEKIIASAMSGLSNPATDQPMVLDNIFQIASMTKAVTSVAAMQLVERGFLSLDDPIGLVLPELAQPEILTDFDNSRNAQTRPAENVITLKHLLTHTSGLGYVFTSPEMAKAQGEVVPASIASITSPLMFEPGTDWLYGVSTDWVGRAVESASGQSLGDYMQEHIFDPLDMHDTGFSVPADKVHRRVSMLSLAGDDFVPFPIEIGGGEAAEFQSGGGGLYSTAHDYMLFMQMILNKGLAGGQRILRPDTVAAMSSNQVGSIRAGKMASCVPLLAEYFDAFPDMQTQWGLGFLINPESGPNGRAPGSLCWAGIANCYYWIDPINHIAGLVLMQYLPFGNKGALAVLGAIEAAVYSE
ncbi:serine hydrolase domain-containing protein [Parasphingorhabdus sp. DH2-15]|uniref:serine hydrolase domain-containing protein n=1 Tax=Parasphingorhabdus sp. DH2-15 TaxID=3444112 RepID=UPI003F68337F